MSVFVILIILFRTVDKISDQSKYTEYMYMFTSKDLDESDHYDEYQSEEFSYSENILDPCCPAHTGAVHPGQEHCGNTQHTNTLKII